MLQPLIRSNAALQKVMRRKLIYLAREKLVKASFPEVTEGFSRVFFDSLQVESFCKASAAAMTPKAAKALHSSNKGANDIAHKIMDEADMVWMREAVHASQDHKQGFQDLYFFVFGEVPSFA